MGGLSKEDLEAHVDNVGHLLSMMKAQPDYGGLTYEEPCLKGTQRNGATPIVNGSTRAASEEIDEGRWYVAGDHVHPGPDADSDADWPYSLVYVSLCVLTPF